MVANQRSTPFKSHLVSEMGVDQDLHISMTRSLMLRTDQKEMFRYDIAQIQSRSVHLDFSDFSVMVNEEETREFLAARFTSDEALRALCTAIGAIVQKHDLPSFDPVCSTISI